MIPGASTNYGTLSRYAVAKVGDFFIWPTILGDSRKIVQMGRDRQVVIISDLPDGASIQDILDDALTFDSSTVAWAVNNEGVPCYFIRLKVDTDTYRTLVYDTQMKEWHEWKWYDGASQTYFPMNDCIYWQAQSKMLFGDVADTGKVFQFGGLTDNTAAITVVLESGSYSRGTTKRKACQAVRLVCELG